MQQNMMLRGVRVETAAKQRLGSNPRRIDTGRLRASISTGPAVTEPIGAAVGTNVEYARFVLFGTSRMVPNPYLTDALNAARL